MATVGSGGGPNPVRRLKQVHNEWLNTKNFLEILESEMLQCKSRIHPRIANTLWTHLFNCFPASEPWPLLSLVQVQIL